MRWKGRRGSENVEDQRGRSPRRVGVGGGLIGIIIVLVAMYLGVDPAPLLNQVQNNARQPAPNQQAPITNPEQEELKAFVKVVLADTEDVWHKLFRSMNKQYQEPRLVLFTGSTQSACGAGSAQMGPFYCPADSKVYIDLSFYDDLKNRFQAPGDFAQAYVIAHEVGHHVQNLLGLSDKVHAARQQLSEKEANELSVRLELQADFFAGVWAHHAEKSWNILEPGDIKEALQAANAIGDDRLQRQSRGTVMPDSFTHGTSEQRMRWFRKGLESGDLREGDTFNAKVL